jgi:hypothetical protein
MRGRVRTEGMKVNFQMKIEKFNAQNLSAKVSKLTKD